MDTPQNPLSRRKVLHLASGAALATTTAAALGAVGPAASPEIELVGGSTQLLIPEPSPDWWNSTSIWTVPGSDPLGSKGKPVAGEPAYVWARVHNVGTTPVNDVKVKFYWANPSLEMSFSKINLIGVANATIPAKSYQDVLCLSAWNVEYVNNGKECLVVAASLPGDPQLPDLIDVPGYPQVAQRNLTVWETAPQRWHSVEMDLFGLKDQSRTVHLSFSIGGELPPMALEQFRLGALRPVTDPVTEVRFSLVPPDSDPGLGEPELFVDVPAGRVVKVFVSVRQDGSLGEGAYQLVTVTGTDRERVIGGLSFIVKSEK